MPGPNVMILAWMGDKWSGGQAQNAIKFDFQAKFDLKSQGRPPLKIIGILTTSDPN